MLGHDAFVWPRCLQPKHFGCFCFLTEIIDEHSALLWPLVPHLWQRPCLRLRPTAPVTCVCSSGNWSSSATSSCMVPSVTSCTSCWTSSTSTINCSCIFKARSKFWAMSLIAVARSLFPVSLRWTPSLTNSWTFGMPVMSRKGSTIPWYDAIKTFCRWDEMMKFMAKRYSWKLFGDENRGWRRGMMERTETWARGFIWCMVLISAMIDLAMIDGDVHELMSLPPTSRITCRWLWMSGICCWFSFWMRDDEVAPGKAQLVMRGDKNGANPGRWLFRSEAWLLPSRSDVYMICKITQWSKSAVLVQNHE